MAKRQKLIHVHSNVYTNGAPKAPDATAIELGEIAINYNDTEPALFIKNNSGEIIKFNPVKNSEIESITTDITNIKSNNKIKLNGIEKSLTGSTWEFYAPTASGATGTVLISKGANTSPEWKAQSTLTAGTSSNALKTQGMLTILKNDGTTLVEFNGASNSSATLTNEAVGAAAASHTHEAGDLPTASTSAYGITKLGTAAGTAAAGNHTHSEYVNPEISNKAATWAWGKTVTAATIGSAAITIAAPTKPTAGDIGAAPASHSHAGGEVDAATTGSRGTVQVGDFLNVTTSGTISVATGTSSTTVAVGNHTHNYAASASAGGPANSTKGTLTIKNSNGTTIADFNGSATTAITLTKDTVGAAAASHSHGASDLPTASTSAYGIAKIGTISGTVAAGDHTHSAYVNPPVTNKSATWAWGETVTAATIGNTAITITAPTKPTASDIGAAASSHSHAGTEISAATASVRGTIKPGSFLSVNTAGTLTILTGTTSSTIARGDHTHTLPSASSETFGIMKAGSFLSATNGVVSVSTGTSSTTVARGDHNHAGVYANASHEHTAADIKATATTTTYGLTKLGTVAGTAAEGNHTHSEYINPTVTNNNITLSWGTKATAATIGNTSITLTPMSKPSASDIGAAAASHSHAGTEVSAATASARGTVSVGNFLNVTTSGMLSVVTGTSSSSVAVGNHTHNYAGSSSAGGAANSTKGTLTIKNSEGTTIAEFNGSTTTAITLTKDTVGAAAASHMHGAGDLPTASTSAYGVTKLGTGAGMAAEGNHTHSTYVNPTVTNKSATWTWGGTVTAATIGNTAITVTAPSLPTPGDIGAASSSHGHDASDLPTATTTAYGITKLGTAAGTAAAGNHTHSEYVNPTVTNKDVTLSWGTKVTAATIGNTSITITPMSKPSPSDIGAAASSHSHAGTEISAATASVRGTVKPGTFLSVDTAGTLTISTGTSSSTIARGDHNHGTASTSTFGVMKVGSFLSASNGVVSVTTGTSSSSVAVGNHTHTPASIGAAASTHSHGIGDLPTASVISDDSTKVPTASAVKSYVDGLVASPVNYKGAVTNGTLPSSPKVGDLYIVQTTEINISSAQSATGVAQKAEVGDYIIARTTSKWDVIQKNITGAVTSSEALTSEKFILGNGNQTVKTSSYGPSSFAASSHSHTAGNLPTASTSAWGITKLGTAAGTAAEGNHTHSAYVNPTVTNKSATWAWGETVTAATIGNTAITMTAPSLPTPSDIGAAASSHTHNYAGSSSAGGAATSAVNSDKVDGYHVAVVTSMPTSPDANTIYILK